ncbi:fukutin-related protein-like [Gigantopelta aegis]|uniref:fukutin-related protein-like n=1 Tax=Gigantopelta aegis TaxID=1735272 RepID=UPI001B88C290|nr:fukutin-related protein-like [Gigantopelta aegis]
MSLMKMFRLTICGPRERTSLRFCRRHRCLVTAVLVNLLIFFYLAVLQHRRSHILQPPSRQISGKRISDGDKEIIIQKNTERLVTVIIRDFEEFDNDVVSTVKSFHDLNSLLNVLVICDKLPYPPLLFDKNFDHSRLQVVSLTMNPLKNLSFTRPETFIHTPYVFIVPDSTKLADMESLYSAISFLKKSVNFHSLALPVAGSHLECLLAKVDIKRWTMEYLVDSDTKMGCDVVMGDHALLITKQHFLQLADPFLKPFSVSFHIQSILRKWKTFIFDNVGLTVHKILYSEPHHRWKHKHNTKLRLMNMYKKLGIKLVQHSDGRKEWHGCTKETPRCFGTVENDMPEYLYQGRWTPPCCLRCLRDTAKHVFKILDKCGVRYWLEGGSLLGAARQGDIIPWDYDVDVGIYQEDIEKCENLKQMKTESFVDDKDFVWEKAIEGDFYRVQYSESNHLHIDLFPFFSRNGTMTKHTWMKSHRQDTEFPERFLKPLTKINFAGMNVSAPNNVKEFLELKFGIGVIESPKYPNAEDPL